MTKSFIFYKSKDFPGAPEAGDINQVKLDAEIRESTITIALDRVDVGTGGDLDKVEVVFKADLSESEEKLLDGHTQRPFLNIQTNASLDPGESPNIGDRYLILDAANIHANFGSIPNLENNDIVEYIESAFEVSFDSNSVDNETALAKNQNDFRYYVWNGISWTAGKAGGLIAAHDNTTSFSTEEVTVINEIVTKKSSIATNVYIFSPDLADKTTWYHDAIQVVDESVSVGDGITTTFQLAHGNGSIAGENILDLAHGKVTDETNIYTPSTATPPSTRGGYLVTVNINGVPVPEREVYSQNGEWTMNYKEGLITFFSPPAIGDTVTCSYWYVPINAAGTIFKVTSDLGSYITIDYVEAQFTTDMSLKDSFIYTYTPTAYPHINLINPLEYKNMYNVIDFSVSALPIIKKSTVLNSGDTISTTRNLTADIQVIPWNYISELNIDGDLVDIPGLGPQKVQLLAYLKNGVPCEGSRVTIVIYGTRRMKI